MATVSEKDSVAANSNEITPVEKTEQPAKKPSLSANQKWLIGVVIVAVVLGIVYFLMLNLYNQDGGDKHTTLTPGTGKAADHIDIDVTVLSLDPVRDQATLRLEFRPKGAYSADGITPNRDLRLNTNSVTSSLERTFAKGKRMNTNEITVDLTGDVSDYPFDKYSTVIELDMVEVVTAADKTTSEKPVPVKIDFNASPHGLHVDVGLVPNSKDGDVGLEMKAARSAALFGFALFVMFVMVLLSAIVLTVVVLTGTQNRKVEFGMFGWIGALLFAFPAIRNTMPGSPPLGALSDYLVFFWALACVVIALFVAAGIWITRPSSK